MKPNILIAKYKSWKDLNRYLETLTKSKQSKKAGDIFECLVKLYLETVPQYRSKLKKVYLLNEVTESLKKKLRLPSTDEGIDLIAETYDKTYWSIQAKYRSNKKGTLTRRDLSTFSDLSFNYCKDIEHGLVCTTVDKPPRKVKLMDNIGFDTIECFYRLDDNNYEEWRAILAKCKGKIIKPKPFKPRLHQKKALKDTTSFLKNNDRGKILMPCGTGKSITAFWIAQNLKAKSILIAVPSLALLQQTLRVWTREYLIHGILPEWLCVCSDDTVKEDQDDYVTNSADVGVKVTTDHNEIKSFLKKRSRNIKVVFTTYQSGQMTAKGAKGYTFDLGIMDEAHKTVGHRHKPMAHLIHNKNIKVKKRIFMTATERLFRGDKDEYVSMDDPRDYGKIIYQLSFKAAIDRKPPIISDYKVITFNVNEPDIEALYKDNKFIQVQKIFKNITAREFATAIALRKAIKKLKIKNAISFHSSIKRAKNFSEQQDIISNIYNDYGKLETFHVSGEMPTNERTSQMREFAEGRGLMTNARCLTEGVDLPAIDCVIFTDPKRSRVDIVQAAGRALRLSKGKNYGYILLPLIIPKDASASEAAKDTAFEEIVTTLKALASQDTRIIDYLRAVSSGSKPRGGSPVDGLINLNKLTNINEEEFEKAINLKVWSRIAFGNWRSFEDAKNYIHSSNIKSSSQYRACKALPPDIPKNPQNVYKGSGWKSWGDYLGTGRVASHMKKFAPYEEAVAANIKHKIKTIEEWKKWKDSESYPKDFPKKPDRVYKDNWISWGKYLGTNYVSSRKRKYLTFNEAKNFLRDKNLKTWKDYKNLKKSYPELHDRPSFYYKNEFTDLYDFFSKPKIFNYTEAKEYLSDKNIESYPDYIKKHKSGEIDQLRLPLTPNQYYGKKFKGVDDFFSKVKFLSFKDAKKYVASLNFNHTEQWHKFKKSKNFPKNIPRNPHETYRKNWKNLNDFLGHKVRKIKNSKRFAPSYKIVYWDFEKARSFIHKQKIKSRDEWESYKKKRNKPWYIPSEPSLHYKYMGYAGINDWLGIKIVQRRLKWANYPNYREAKKIMRKYKNINSASKWQLFAKREEFRKLNLPSKPNIYYKKQWKGWGDFLGTGNIASHLIKFKSYKKAKEYARSLNITPLSHQGWIDYFRKNKRPTDIPANPRSKYYADGWKGWPDFLSSGK